MSNIAAFFDIDGTFYRQALIVEMFKKMVTHELIDPSRWTDEVKPYFMAWDRREGDYDDYLDRMVEIFKEISVGLSSEHIELIADRVVEQKGERVNKYARERLLWHKSQGHKVIAISGSPDALVNKMCEKHGFDDWRATIYHTDEKGIYTGEITPMWDSRSKKKAMEELAVIYDLDLMECYSYGDTNGDMTMFMLTGHPTAINPTREVLNRVKEDTELKKNMKIIVERKDVTYDIDIDSVRLIDY